MPQVILLSYLPKKLCLRIEIERDGNRYREIGIEVSSSRYLRAFAPEGMKVSSPGNYIFL
jgi:hypothetical protein